MDGIRNHSKRRSLFIIALFCASLFIYNFTISKFLNTSQNREFPAPFDLNTFKDIDLDDTQQYRMIIQFQSAIDVTNFIEQNSLGLTILKRYRLIPAVVVLASPAEAKAIASLDGVKKIWVDRQINYLPAPNIDQIDNPENSATELSTADLNFNLTSIQSKYNGSNVIVAVLDTGIDPTHPDLDDQDDNETTNESKIINGVSFVEMEPFYLGDFNGHGTYVAGIIAGTGNASGGAYRGVAPGALLMNVKVLSSTGDGYWSWIISGIEYAVTHGADIIAMCFSGPGYPNDPLCLAIDAAVSQGVLVIAATGDDGPSYSSIGAPGMAYSAVTIGNYDQFRGTLAQNSSRGPIMDLRTGPDLIAAGVNIASCRVNKTGVPKYYEASEFGSPLNESYTVASGSFAAAAFTAGACALLLQAFQLLDPQSLKMALLKNAYDIGLNPNLQGCGVLDVNSTFNYLNRTYGEDALLISRLYTPALPYGGVLGIDNLDILNLLFNRTIATNCSIGSYADFGVMTYYNKTNDFNTTHLLMSRFGIKYNQQEMKWLSDFRVLREMHYVSRGFYDRSISILTDETLLITILVESWDFINSTGGSSPVRNVNGFKISIVTNNLVQMPVSAVSLYSWWKMDLFYNETDYNLDDFGCYNDSDDILYVNDTYENTSNSTFIGLKAQMPTTACEVESTEKTYDDVVKDNLSSPKFQSWAAGDVGLASKWTIGNLNSNEFKVFSAALGIGSSYLDLRNQTEWILHNTTMINITDLAVCDFNISIGRMSEINNSLYTDIMVINIGTVPISNVTTKFTLNSSSYDYSLTFTNRSLEPYHIQRFSGLPSPSSLGVYNFTWYAINTTQGDIPENATMEELAQRDNQPLDNIFSRNIFVYDRKALGIENGTAIFPSKLLFVPLLVQMPGDYIKYNVSIFSIAKIDNISFQVQGNATELIEITPDLIQNPSFYSFFAVEFNIPIFQQPGYYNSTITITLNSNFALNIPVNFTLTDYTKVKGRILFDASHGSIETIEDWEERLDSIYARYFDFYQLAANQFYNMDELPFGGTITAKYLSYYDCIIICDPERGYNATEREALKDYVIEGGTLLVLAENSEGCNTSSLNSIINEFGVNISQIYTDGILYENLTTVLHTITQGIEGLELSDAVNISATGKARLLTNHLALINSSDDTNSKLLVMGDSDLFANEYLSSQNNSLFAINCFQWLLSSTIKMQVQIYSNITAGAIYLGDKVHISINILVPNASKSVSTEASILVAAIVFPNSTTYYHYFSFYLREGWHSMFFFTSIANQTGWYSMTIFCKHVAGVSLYNTTIPAFYVNASLQGRSPEEVEPPPGASFPPSVGVIALWGVTLILLLIWTRNALKLSRKIKSSS